MYLVTAACQEQPSLPAPAATAASYKGVVVTYRYLPDGMGAEKRKDEIHPWEGHLIWPFISAYLKRCPVDSDIFQTIGRFMMTRTNCII